MATILTRNGSERYAPLGAERSGMGAYTAGHELEPGPGARCARAEIAAASGGCIRVADTRNQISKSLALDDNMVLGMLLSCCALTVQDRRHDPLMLSD